MGRQQHRFADALYTCGRAKAWKVLPSTHMAGKQPQSCIHSLGLASPGRPRFCLWSGHAVIVGSTGLHMHEAQKYGRIQHEADRADFWQQSTH